MKKFEGVVPTFVIQQSTQRPLTLAVVLLTLLGSVGFVFFLGRLTNLRPIRFSDTGPTIEQVQSLNQLVSSKVVIADVLTGEDDGYRGAWLIKGDALVAVDLSRAELQEVDKVSRKAVLLLPSPAVVSARVDHERSKTWDIKSTSWMPWNGDFKSLQDRSMLQAQKLIEHAGNQPDMIERAKTSAVQSLSGFYRAVDWKVEIRWK